MRSLLIFIILLVGMSCRTVKYIDNPIPIETVKVEYINQLYKDSVYIRDSVDRFISGDTIYQYKYKYIYKYLNRVDTVIKTDSVEVPIKIKTTEIKEINNLKWYQIVLMYLGIGALLVGIYKVSRLIKVAMKKIANLS